MWSITKSSRTRTKASRLGLVAGAVAVLALAAACGNGSSSGSSAGSGGGAVNVGAASGGVATVSTPLGTILTDSNGMTLYAFAADSKGTSNCSAQCLQYWPPVSPGSTTTPPSSVTAKLGSITGTNGSKQLTVDGWPMYTYAGDSNPGDTKGQGMNLSGGLWWVVGTDGSWIKAAGSGGSSSGSSGGSTSGYSRGGY